VPSDREVPRSINEGVPIVRAKGKSDAAKAFRNLAQLYVQREAAKRNGGRRLFRRKR
jgi:MinD-like ATPase involved in chromosome partitioning or flagellar assembly